VDNAYLLVLLSSGVLGLALLSIAYWRFWMLLHTRAIASRAPLLKGIAGLFSTVPFFCFINDLPLQTLLLLLLAVSLADEDDVRFAPGLSAVPEQHLMLA
jgi:hypothetical protein